MPTEIRHLMFRPQEVASAVGGYYHRLGKTLPPGMIATCLPEGDGKTSPLAVRVTMAPGPDGGAAVTLLLDEVTLTAVLLLYCQGRKIPMSARASKALMRFGEQVCLVATLNPKQEEMPPGDGGG